MSTNKTKYEDLPKLQKSIILCLAKVGPQIIVDTNKKIKGSNTSTARAFHELERKDMIFKTSLPSSYRGRDFPKYWLTPRGIAYALLHGANSSIVENYAVETSEGENQKGIRAYFAVRSSGQTVASILDKFLLSLGRIDMTGLVMSLLPEMMSMSETERTKLFQIAMKQDYWKHTENVLFKIKEEISKVLSHE